MNPAPATLDLTAQNSEEIVQRFLADLHSGADWFEALLDAIGRWRTPQEVHNGCKYRYLVGDEAFDWLLLAERLLSTANGMIPESEKERLLFQGVFPRSLSGEAFKDRIGPAKYRAVVNHWYGVRVEEALILAVEHEVRKQRRGLRAEEPKLEDVVYEHVYGLSRRELFAQFSLERKLPQQGAISLRDYEEFTYWLFHYRLKRSDKARLASDTKKGLSFLRQMGRPSSLLFLGVEYDSREAGAANGYWG